MYELLAIAMLGIAARGFFGRLPASVLIYTLAVGATLLVFALYYVGVVEIHERTYQVSVATSEVSR